MRRLAGWRVIVCVATLASVYASASVALSHSSTSGVGPGGGASQTLGPAMQSGNLRVSPTPEVVAEPLATSVSTPAGNFGLAPPSSSSPTPTPSLFIRQLPVDDLLPDVEITPTPLPANTPTPIFFLPTDPKITLTPTPTRKPTRTPVPTKTPKPTPTYAPRPTPRPTSTPTPTILPTRTPTSTATPLPVQPSLSIPSGISTTPEGPVAVPITFDSDGANVSSITFSVDYDEACLSFDSTDGNEDGLPDSVNLRLPATFGVTRVTHDAEDTDGEIDFVLVDTAQPFEAIPEGVIVEVSFNVDEAASCWDSEAGVGFASDPQAEFSNDEGRRLGCETKDGTVTIVRPPPTYTPTPTPTATPVPANPSLSIPEDISAVPGQTVNVSIALDSDGAEISGVTFSLQYDQSCLSFDPTDDDSDGLPDSVSLSLSAEFGRTLIAEAPEDSDREIDVVLADLVLPLAAMPDGVIVSIELSVDDGPACWGETIVVGFWADTPATYFDTGGEEVTGTTDDGSIEISDPPATPTPTPTPTATPEPVLEGPSLTIPSEIEGTPGQTVAASISFDADDNRISALTFSVDFDQTCLSFDASTGLAFKVPPSFITQALYDSSDTDGEVDFTVYSLNTTVPEGAVVEITFTVSSEQGCRGATADVGFSDNPSAVFGDDRFRPVQGWTQDGSVQIADS